MNDVTGRVAGERLDHRFTDPTMDEEARRVHRGGIEMPTSNNHHKLA